MPRLITMFITHTDERIARSVMSMAGQTRRPDAVVVACDGDPAGLRDEIDRAARFIDRPVLLVTRPHTGQARPAQTRNNAVRGFRDRFGLRPDDRLVFFDGDCIAPANVLALHEDALRRRPLSLGWRIELRADQAARLTDGDAGRTYAELADPAQRAEIARTARTYARRQLQRRLGLTKPHKPQVLGANFAVVASMYLSVNGLDETYTGWGMEDDDFGRRVYRAGGRAALRVRDCVVLHQYHPTRSRDAWKDNEQAHRLDLPFVLACEHGLENPLPQPEVSVEAVGAGSMEPSPSPNPDAPFFVVGTGRCGSTLLQAMLMSHPDLRMPPETQYFEHLDPAALGFADPLPDEQVNGYLHRALTDRARFFLDARPGTADAYGDAVRTTLRSARDQFLWICARLTAAQSGDQLGEKTPQHWQSIGRITALFPQARFVHLVRDPRDVVAGLLEMDWWENNSARKTAKHWRNAIRAAVDHRLRDPDRHLTVRYEDLVERPEPVLRDICGFLGVSFHPAMLSHRASARRSFAPGEIEYKGLATEPIDRSRTGRYRTRLSASQIRVIEATVGVERMRELGYSPDDQVARPVWSAFEPILVRAAESLRGATPAASTARGGPS